MNPSRFLPILAATILVGAAVAPAAAKSTAAKSTPSAKHAVVPFIDDDLDRALAEAKQRDVPLFIESWAPW